MHRSFYTLPLARLAAPVAAVLGLAGAVSAQCTPEYGTGYPVSSPAAITSSGDLIFASSQANPEFQIIDASDPAIPFGLGSLDLPNYPRDLVTSGSVVFGGMPDFSGVVAIDISDPANPAELDTLPFDQGYGMELHDTTLYVAGRLNNNIGVAIIDVSDPSNMVQIGFAQVPFATFRNVFDVAVSGTHLYTFGNTRQFTSGMWVFDISNPAAPIEVNSFGVGNATNNVRMVAVGDVLYLSAAGVAGTLMYDLTDPVNPVQFDMLPGASDLDLHDDVLYAVTGGGVAWYDVSDPTLPTLIDSLVDPGVTLERVSISDTGASGYGLSGVFAIEVCARAGGLSLEIADCPDDADPVEPGYQIAVELWMRGVTVNATGFQAFLNYDDTALSYRGDLSTYSASPFELHIQSTAGAEVAAGELRLDGTDNFGEPGESADSLLATLIFDVDVDCSTTVPVTFDTGQAFPSELSSDGDPIATTLTDAPSITMDDTDPVLDPCPDDITQAADANVGDGCQSAIVTWTDPMATDNCDPAPVVVCSPASGSVFPVGTTTVTCTATDSCGNESICTFDVTVTATNAVNVDVELAGVNIAVMRCIYFATDDCSFNNVMLSFVDHDGDDVNENGIDDATEGGLDTPSTSVRAITTIEVPCGNWTTLCAKDQQHTLWSTTSLTLGAAYTADTLLGLAPGDTDNDGDVDINDVTLLIAQFGNPALPGGCPWDGTRDSDFSNNGVVGSEDYSLLSSNWLMQSSCTCSSAGFGGLDRRYATEIWTNQLPRQIGLRADMNHDGVVNHRDVAIFERANGLSDVLSTKMLLTQQLRRP